MEIIETYLRRFGLSEELHSHVLVVMGAMPAVVRDELMADTAFVLAEVSPGAEIGVPAPGRKPSRAVVLKRRMWRTDTHFVRWVIAHEFAHAHLRNGGSPQHPDDPERAADALAAEWGFTRPPRE